MTGRQKLELTWIGKDKGLIASLDAMKRAAAQARQQAVQTDTAIVVLRERKIVRLTAETIRKEGER